MPLIFEFVYYEHSFVELQQGCDSGPVQQESLSELRPSPQLSDEHQDELDEGLAPRRHNARSDDCKATPCFRRFSDHVLTHTYCVSIFRLEDARPGCGLQQSRCRTRKRAPRPRPLKNHPHPNNAPSVTGLGRYNCLFEIIWVVKFPLLSCSGSFCSSVSRTGESSPALPSICRALRLCTLSKVCSIVKSAES